jgi:hypothetical protein
MTNGAEKLKAGNVTISGDLYAFLMGEGPLDGTWFDEMKLPGKFWWRALLRAAERATRTPAPSSDIEEMVERVQRHIAQMETHPPGGSRELVPLHTIRAVLEARAALTATG